VLFAGSALPQANVTFSFASDDTSQGVIFGPSSTDRLTAFDAEVTLRVDDANGPLPTLSLASEFEAALDFTLLAALNIGGGQFAYTYQVDGSFRFDEVGTDEAILGATLDNAILTIAGGVKSWGSAGALQASSIGGASIQYTWLGDALPGYNLFTGGTSTFADAAFTLTNLIDVLNGGLSGVPIDVQTGLPTTRFTAESSFSGSAFFVPSPAGATVMLVAGALTMRRRR
jgi:hypothetical protein